MPKSQFSTTEETTAPRNPVLLQNKRANLTGEVISEISYHQLLRNAHHLLVAPVPGADLHQLLDLALFLQLRLLDSRHYERPPAFLFRANDARPALSENTSPSRQNTPSLFATWE